MSTTGLVAVAILLLSAAPVWADEAEDAFNSLYGNEYKRVAGTPDKNDDVALAADLLKAAKAPGVHPALLAILCDKAYELGTKAPAGYGSAIEAMEILAQRVPDKAADALKNLLAVRERQYQAAKGLDKADAGEVFIEALLVAADASTKGGATAEAMAFLRKAFGAAKAVKSDRQNEIQGRIDRATMRERLRKQVSDLKARLAANPQDVAARKEALRLCLVDLDDPAEAATFLDDSSDEAMRKYVPAAAKGVGAAPQLACLELGQWYHGLAGDAHALSKPGMLTRARDYLERFLELHTVQDANRLLADQLLATIQEQLSKLGQGTAAPLERNLVLGVWFFRQREGPLVDSRRKPVAIQGEWRWVADDSFERPTQTVEFRKAFAAWPNEPAFMLRTGSITAWVKYAGGRVGVAGKGLAGYTVGHDDYGIYIDGGRFCTFMGWPKISQVALAAAPVPLNRWCFLAYSWDEKKAAFWMDGRPLGVFPLPTPLKLTEGRFEIGVNSPGDPEYFVGCMAGVHLYNVFLTDKQVAELAKFEAQFMRLRPGAAAGGRAEGPQDGRACRAGREASCPCRGVGTGPPDDGPGVRGVRVGSGGSRRASAARCSRLEDAGLRLRAPEGVRLVGLRPRPSPIRINLYDGGEYRGNTNSAQV
jgi:tetratricopeptide (TPR) repeat protein